MSETKFTPGPWSVGDLDHNSQRIVRQEHIEICTCWHHGVGSIEREMEANAHLIAAAPDLYAALLSLANSADGLRFREEAIRNIVGNTNWNVLRQHIADARAAIAKARGEQ